MDRLFAPLIIGVCVAFFLVPSDGSHPFSYVWGNNSYPAPPKNGHWSPQWNSSRTWPTQKNYSYPHWPTQKNYSYHHWPRYPRSAQYWGDSSNPSHNFFWGYKSLYDRLLFYSRIKRESSFLRKVTLDVEYPARHQRPNGTITYIQILDQKPAGLGGYATIVRGGVGYKNVTVHFKSQRNKDFDFIYSIYGYGY